MGLIFNRNKNKGGEVMPRPDPRVKPQLPAIQEEDEAPSPEYAEEDAGEEIFEDDYEEKVKKAKTAPVKPSPIKKEIPKQPLKQQIIREEVVIDNVLINNKLNWIMLKLEELEKRI